MTAHIAAPNVTGTDVPATMSPLILQAGADIVLGPQNFVEAFDAVVRAVEDGVLTEQRIDQSIRRILWLKRQMGRD